MQVLAEILAKTSLSLATFLYIAWVSYVKGWSDSSTGTPNKIGKKNDMWHIVTRYLEYWPALIAFPSGVFFGHFIGLTIITGAIPALVTARLWFRWGVHENGKYLMWYGKEFTIMGALVWHK
jgi:hypothetical protein